jgi:hypothetical protein
VQQPFSKSYHKTASAIINIVTLLPHGYQYHQHAVASVAEEKNLQEAGYDY